MEKVHLGFHRFFSSVIMPINTFIGIYSLLVAVRNLTVSCDTLNIVMLLFSIVVLVLVFCTFRGLLRFKRSAFIALVALMTIKIVDNSVSLYLYMKESLASYVLASAFGIAFSVFVLCYYIKRRKLFSKDGAVVIKLTREDFEKARKEALEAQKTKEEETASEEEEVIPEFDCPRCSYHITNGAVFCPRCGYQTRSVNH